MTESNTKKIFKKINEKNVPIFSLVIIIGISLLIRLYYFSQYQSGFSDDAMVYFWYANDIKILGQLPDHVLTHGGWPMLLSIFFKIFYFNNFWDYIALQKLVSIIISAGTIIPIYFLCNRFFGKYLSLLGAIFFAIEPRLIQNSLLGITEPLYILLLSIIFFLFLSSDKKFVYMSFGFLGLSTMVRFESIILFVPLSIIFFLQFRNEKNIVKKYLLTVIIFSLMLIPMIAENTLIGNENIVANRIDAELSYIGGELIKDPQNIPWYYNYNFENIVKILGWSMIPIFLMFVPFGVILILKNWEKRNIFIILATIFTLIPGFYALLRFADVRYLFPTYPMFCVISLFAIKWYNEKIQNKKLFIMILLVGVVFSSALFLEYKVKVDEVHESEALSIAKEVIHKTEVINQYSPESKYIMIAQMSESKFPILSSDFKKSPLLDYDANSLEEYLRLGEKMGLTHLVLDGKDSIYRPIFFKEVFENEEKYPYLLKIYDSVNHNFKYHVKIFEIDYAKFHQMINLKT
jgi:hypothetical protein